MAVPKRKVSKARRDKRRTHKKIKTPPAIIECPECSEMKLSHHMCPGCGYYKRRVVVEIEE